MNDNVTDINPDFCTTQEYTMSQLIKKIIKFYPNFICLFSSTF